MSENDCGRIRMSMKRAGEEGEQIFKTVGCEK